jgi:hypothetical protein
MSSIFDAATYPFHQAIARELHLTLCQLYPSSKAAVFAAQKAGVPQYLIDADQAPYLVWKSVLETATNGGLLRAVVDVASKDFPRSPSHALLAALLADVPPKFSAEPRNVDGAPSFRHGADDVTEHEALLFHDDLTLPTGRLTWLIAVLERLRELVPAVCRLEVVCAAGIASGTGFRIGPDLVLTNWHVLYPEGHQPTAITATFGYEDDGKGVGLSGTAIGCDVTSVKANKDDDWGVVRVSQPMPAAVPLLSLQQSASPSLLTTAFIIQHPGGQRKRVAYARNQVTFFDERVVQYLSDTQTGSSGSPVFNEEGRLIALHHAGGRPQEVAGQAPLTKNEGIRIDRVAQGIAAAGINL